MKPYIFLYEYLILTCDLVFFTIRLILEGNVDPHLSLMLTPFGFIPIETTLAPNSFKSFGAALLLSVI